MQKKIKPKIQILNSHTAEKIAAGEVVERPASIVKELVENALDAQANEILIRLVNGGKDLIEVWDNGYGMCKEDLQLSVQRHATSKLQSIDDLDRITTLGFRGEALPSIAAVSELTLTSRLECDPENQIEAYCTTAHTGQTQEITFGNFIDSTHGTRIQVKSLFAQIPARLKFLKSQAAEVSAAREWVEKLSLAYPQVGFRLTSNERELLNVRPQSKEERIREILGDDSMEHNTLETIYSEQDGVRDLGLQFRIDWLKGISSPQNRKLIQIVNSRVVRDRLLQQALLSPFRQSLLPGQFPALVLTLDIDPAAIDVNVHPVKTEVRFLRGQKIFQAIESSLHKRISEQKRPQVYSPTRAPQMLFSQDPLKAAEPSWLPWNTLQPDNTHSHAAVHDVAKDMTQTEVPTRPTARLVGVVFNAYVIYEEGAELILIDQHAAHERIRYEKLKKQNSHHETSPQNTQLLLIPETIRFPLEEKEKMEKRIEFLIKNGFEVEFFGEDRLTFRAVPALWGTTALKTRLNNLIDRILSSDLLDKHNLEKDEALFESLASQACHSAVRAGDPLHPEEIKTLISELFSCEHPWNCPHGRPTVFKIPLSKLNSWFQRV